MGKQKIVRALFVSFLCVSIAFSFNFKTFAQDTSFKALGKFNSSKMTKEEKIEFLKIYFPQIEESLERGTVFQNFFGLQAATYGNYLLPFSGDLISTSRPGQSFELGLTMFNSVFKRQMLWPVLSFTTQYSRAEAQRRTDSKDKFMASFLHFGLVFTYGIYGAKQGQPYASYKASKCFVTTDFALYASRAQLQSMSSLESESQWMPSCRFGLTFNYHFRQGSLIGIKLYDTVSPWNFKAFPAAKPLGFSVLNEIGLGLVLTLR